MAEIRRFEIDSYGTIKVHTPYKNGRSTMIEYNSCPPSIIKKFLNAKSAPDTKDLDDWMKTYRDKQDSNSGMVCCDSSDFWSSKD
jgi:hypothetical protein